MMRLNRRRLLLGTLGLTATIAVGGSLAVAASGFEPLIVRIVRRRLPDLAIDPRALDQFADDYLSWDRTTPAYLVRALELVAPVALSDGLAFAIPGPARRAIEQYERKVLTRFFLSTDFFEPGRAQGSAVTYLAFADPYAIGCANPLANRAEL